MDDDALKERRLSLDESGTAARGAGRWLAEGGAGGAAGSAASPTALRPRGDEGGRICFDEQRGGAAGRRGGLGVRSHSQVLQTLLTSIGVRRRLGFGPGAQRQREGVESANAPRCAFRGSSARIGRRYLLDGPTGCPCPSIVDQAERKRPPRCPFGRESSRGRPPSATFSPPASRSIRRCAASRPRCLGPSLEESARAARRVRGRQGMGGEGCGTEDGSREDREGEAGSGGGEEGRRQRARVAHFSSLPSPLCIFVYRP